MMNLITIIISAFALALSLFSFIRFDFKIKEQEIILNNFKIKKNNEDDHNKLYAHLSLDTYWRDKNTLKLTIKNSGPSDAYSITVENLDKESFLFKDIESSFPISKIDAGDSVEMDLLVYSDLPNKNMVKITWEDNSTEKRTEMVVLSIH